MIVFETPPAMNSPIPEPIPHFETTSSRYIKRIEPRAIWNIADITIGWPAAHASPRKVEPSLNPITTAAASNTAIITVRIFCVP